VKKQQKISRFSEAGSDGDDHNENNNEDDDRDTHPPEVT
jgi:hypothetical protein